MRDVQSLYNSKVIEHFKNPRAVAKALDGLPPIKMHCSVLAEEALKSAIEDYYARPRVEIRLIITIMSLNRH